MGKSLWSPSLLEAAVAHPVPGIHRINASRSVAKDACDVHAILPRPEGRGLSRVWVNHWIRTSHEFEAVIDLEAVVRDPAHPTRLAPQFDSGDHLHPNDAGYAAMANSIDLKLFRLE